MTSLLEYLTFRDIMLWILAFLLAANPCKATLSGPTFVKEPPAKVLFYNTTGTVLSCSCQGSPTPTISWVDEEGKPVSDVAGLRQIRKDGSLVFLPFRGDEYRLDVHAASYRCTASNSVGTIGSRISAVRAVIYQKYEIRVYDEYVIRGNSAVMRCHVPSYVKDYVIVTSWMGDDGIVVFPHSSLDANSKFSVLPSTGELLVRNVQTEDGKIIFKCHVKNALSGHTEGSASGGKLVVTEPHTSVPPRVTHFLHQVSAKQGDNAVLPCVAQGFPVPRHQWFRSSGSQLEYLHLGHRHKQQDGVLVLHRVSVDEAGSYVCSVSNDVGEEKVEMRLTVTVPLSVSIHPHHQEVNKGVQVSINCTVVGQPLDFVEWRKNMEAIVADRRISFHSRTLLNINSVEQRDRGMYQCFVGNEEGATQAVSQLLVLSEPPLLLHAFDDITIRPGQQASLKCSATGNPLPQITWSTFGYPVRDSHNVRLGDYVSRDGSVVSFVNFTSVSLSDGGHYECRVENDYGLVIHGGQMKVTGPPYIRDLSNRTAIAGQSISITCPVTSAPIQKITWEKGGKQLPLGRRHKVFANGTLVIQDVDRIEDNGRYTCFAEADNGEKSHKDMHLKVLVPPAITPIAASTNLQEGMRTSLTCSVPVGDPPIRIRWYKDGQSFGGTLSAEMGVSTESIDDFISTLVFKSLRRDNSGTYTCLATNDAAAVNFSVPINVNAPPRWKIEPRDLDVIVGSRAVIDCQATGKPEPRVLWKKSLELDSPDFKTVISGSRVQTLMNGSLVFREIEPEDSGRFMCEASNGVGAPLSTVINLKVHVPVHFNMPFEALTVAKNDPVEINCDAQGETPITYLWFKEGQAIKSSAYTSRSDQIIIERSDRSDTGLYSCVASNAYGQEKKTIQLTVQDRPDPPSDLSIVSVSSKSVTLSWKTPFTGNAALTKYILQMKKARDSWDSGSRDVVVANEQVETMVQDLTPMTDYHFRLAAENIIGLSDYTAVSSVTTSEEVPGGPPTGIRVISTSSTSLHVSWQAPSISLQHGRIKGYYIGYKVYGSTEPFIYKTVDSKADTQDGECDIDNLRRASKYVVVVQAFNVRGAGPLSDEVTAETLELDPPSPPILRAVALTSSSVRLTWHSEKGVNQVSGHVLQYRKEGEEWMEIQLPPETSSYTVEELTCGTRYQFYIYAFNRVGKGDPSEVIALKTEGAEPVPPNERHLIVRNVTSFSLLLNSWGDGGCPIKHFVVQFRRESEQEWNLLSSSIRPDQEVALLVDLSPGTWYNLLMSAFNDAGEAQVEYSVATLTLSGGTVEPKTGSDPPDNSKLRSLSIIVPVTSALLVLVAVGIAVFFLVCKKRSGRSSNIYEGVRASETGGPKGEAIVLGEIEKPYEQGREQVYFPSPYASSKVPPSSMGREHSEGHLDSPRSFGHSGLRGLPHVYDVPQHLRGGSSREQDSCSNYQLSPTSLSRYNGVSLAKVNFAAELEGKLCNYGEHRPLSSHAASHNVRREADKRWSAPLYSEKPRLRSGLALRYGVYPPQIGLGDMELSDTECDQDLNDLYDIVCLEDHLAFLHLLASGERPIIEEADENAAYFDCNHIDDR